MVTIIKRGSSIEDIRKQVDKIVSKSPKKSIKKFAGKLITDIDPIEYQRQMRDEWE